MHQRSRALLTVLITVLTVVLAVSLLTDAPAQARRKATRKPGWQPFAPAKPYHGDFPDPSVIRVGDRYIAHATNTHGVTLPTLISANLKTWFARPATRNNPTGDGLLRTASWSAATLKPGGRKAAEVWAPTVTRIRKNLYVLAYATRVRSHWRQRMCISVATSRTPWGIFVDRTRRPLVCPRNGAIDPQVYKPRRGRPWLIWKVDRHPARIYTRAMNRRGTHLARHSRAHLLAKVAQRWEGGVVENPGLIRYRGRYYLFYSGNAYGTRHYAIGYLICRSLHGGCHRPRHRPLIASHGLLAGPGGAAPFVDRNGRLRLAYHAWRRGQVGYAESPRCKWTKRGCPQRRLYVATVRPRHNGRLVLVHRR